MAICPKCKAEINDLDYEGREILTGSFNGEDVDFDGQTENEEKFSCPECGDELFDNRSDAEDFLIGD